MAVICANQAWAYGCLGDEAGMRKLLGRTRDELERVPAGALARYGLAGDWSPATLSALANAVDTVVATRGRLRLVG